MAFFQTANLWIQELADGVVSLVLDGADERNTLNLEFVADFERALDLLEAQPRFHLLMVRSGKPYDFSVGIDLHEATRFRAEEWEELSRRGQALCERISRSRLISVAVIGGRCLGAALELALACDYRVVVEKPGTVLAFPEIEVGLIPCWGGTVRLPRKIGLDHAQQLVLTGKKCNARQARALGIADELADEEHSEAPRFLENPIKQVPGTIVRRSWRQWILESNGAGRHFLRRGTERILRRRLPHAFLAPWEALDLIYRSFQENDLEPSLLRERQSLAKLLADPAYRNLVAYQNRRESLRVETSRSVKMPKTVGIVGLGVRGMGMLLQVVNKGCQAVVHETDEAALGFSLFRIFQTFQDEVNRGSMTAIQMQKNLGAIRGTVSWKNFDEADLVFDTRGSHGQNDPEFFHEIESHLSGDAILVGNGFVPDTDAIASTLDRPHLLAWAYWHEPISRHSLVELVEARCTDPNLRSQLAEFLRSMGKAVIKVAETPGLLVHRILAPMLNEVGILLKQGASPEQIDEAMRGFGMDPPPCERMDRLGLANVASLFEACQPYFEGRLTFESGFREMWQAGWSGKPQRGFFEYSRGRPSPNNSIVAWWQSHSDGTSVSPLSVRSKKDWANVIEDRLVTLCMLEAIRWRLEFPDTKASDLDFALESVGWPAHRGGPLQMVRDLGIAEFEKRTRELAESDGTRFALPDRWQSALSG